MVGLSDFIDARPRVADYNTSSTTSPFDYDTRSFTVSGTKPPVIVGDDVVTLGYSHYLARIDKIYLTKDGFFELKKGILLQFLMLFHLQIQLVHLV